MSIELAITDDTPEPLDPFYVHEALDRTHVAICHIEEHIYSHPLILQRPEIRALIESALGELSEAYQKIGELA